MDYISKGRMGEMSSTLFLRLSPLPAHFLSFIGTGSTIGSSRMADDADVWVPLASIKYRVGFGGFNGLMV